MVILNASCFAQENAANLAADKVAEFCEETLDKCMGGNSGTVLVSSVQAGQTTILHTLGLMKETICKFSKNHIKVSAHKIFILVLKKIYIF